MNAYRTMKKFACLISVLSSWAHAQTPIEVGIPYQFSQEATSTASYQITLPQPGEYKIHLTNWITTYNWGKDYDRLYITNDESLTVQRGVFSSDEDPFAFHMMQDREDLIFRVGTAGTYTINVHSGELDPGASQAYGLQVTATYSNDLHEPNDSPALATPISLGASVQGYQWKRTKTSAVHGDEDYYQIQIPTPGKLRIELINWTAVYNWGSDFDRFFIYDATGKNIGGASEDDNGYYRWMMGGGTVEEPFVIEMNLAKGGTYYIRFHAGAATSLTPYSFSTSFTQVNDTYESNDTFATAKPILKFDTWQNAYAWRSLDQTMNVSGDEDYYKIQIPTPGKLRIDLINWTAVYNWGADFDRFFIYDATGKNIGGASEDDNGYYRWMMGGGTAEKPFAIEMNLAKGGTYYLRFHAGAATSLTPYSFSASFTQANDTHETNETFATAKPILKTDTWQNACAWRSLDQTMTVTGDEDYYYFNAAGPGQYTITLENWIGIYNWGADYDRLYVYDASQQSVGASPFSWMMGTTPITFEVPAAGKYYILLHCGAGFSTDGYRIKLTGNLLGPDIAVEQPLRKNLVDGNATTNFGKAAVGKAGKVKTYTIRNKGITTLKLSNIRKSGPAAKSFLVSKPGKSSLAPGKSTTFTITFKPKTKGPLEASIQIPNNDTDENPFDLKLLGTGVK
jgi:Abnormal spindle-like microcephaly-assoc'd, ASPM-SPD-2-Hydin